MSETVAAAQTPIEIDGLVIEPQANAAAGLPAIYQAFRHIGSKAGLLHGTGLLLRMNQRNGFDCPGCAWPDPLDHRSVFEFCENGAKALAEEAMTAHADGAFFQRYAIRELSEQSDYWLGQQGRLTDPMWLPPGSSHYQAISWERAADIVAEHLHALASPHQAIFYTSGRTSNEAAFLYQLFARAFGTNNLPDSSNMCHESTSVGLKESIGVSKGSVTLDDFTLADVILLVGQNPGTNHPRMLATLANAAKRGCKIISINPLREAGLSHFKNPKNPSDWFSDGTAITDIHVPLRINGDVALFKGIQKAILARSDGKGIDRAFIDQYADGFDAFARATGAVEWNEIVASSGVAQKTIEQIADIVANASRVICCWAMGVTQHRNGVANVQEMVNLLLMGGHVGRPGAGVCPVRGHSNVQGDRTMGICVDPTAEFCERLGAVLNFTPPLTKGLDVVNAIHAMASGEARVFVALGGNFLSASPDTEATAAALRRCDLTVHIATKLNRSQLVTGKQALILPCLGRSDADERDGRAQFVTVENSMGFVSRSQGSAKPPSTNTISEVAIVAQLAERVLGDKIAVPWSALSSDYARIRDLIAAVIPGFDHFNKRLHTTGGFSLPHAVRDARVFPTASGRAQFVPHAIPNEQLSAGQFLLMTIRTHDQFNTTIYGMDDRYRGVFNGRRVVFMNPEDMRAGGFESNALVDITSHHNGKQRHAPQFAVVPYAIPLRCLAAYYPETNVLVPLESVAEKSNTPTSKSIVVTLRASR